MVSSFSFFFFHHYRASDLVAEVLIFCLSLKKPLIRVGMRQNVGTEVCLSDPGNTVQTIAANLYARHECG